MDPVKNSIVENESTNATGKGLGSAMENATGIRTSYRIKQRAETQISRINCTLCTGCSMKWASSTPRKTKNQKLRKQKLNQRRLEKKREEVNIVTSTVTSSTSPEHTETAIPNISTANYPQPMEITTASSVNNSENFEVILVEERSRLPLQIDTTTVSSVNNSNNLEMISINRSSTSYDVHINNSNNHSEHLETPKESISFNYAQLVNHTTILTAEEPYLNLLLLKSNTNEHGVIFANNIIKYLSAIDAKLNYRYNKITGLNFNDKMYSNYILHQEITRDILYVNENIFEENHIVHEKLDKKLNTSSDNCIIVLDDDDDDDTMADDTMADNTMNDIPEDEDMDKNISNAFVNRPEDSNSNIETNHLENPLNSTKILQKNVMKIQLFDVNSTIFERDSFINTSALTIDFLYIRNNFVTYNDIMQALQMSPKIVLRIKIYFNKKYTYAPYKKCISNYCKQKFNCIIKTIKDWLENFNVIKLVSVDNKPQDSNPVCFSYIAISYDEWLDNIDTYNMKDYCEMVKARYMRCEDEYEDKPPWIDNAENDFKILFGLPTEENDINEIRYPLDFNHNTSHIFPGYDFNKYLYIKKNLASKNDSFLKDNKLKLTTGILTHILKPFTWFTDESINAYFKLIEMKSGDLVYSFDSYFVNGFLKHGMNSFHRKIMTIDLTKFKYLLFPVNVNNNHWTLYVVDLKAKRIIYYDSFNHNKHYLYFFYSFFSYISIYYFIHDPTIINLNQWTIEFGNSPIQNNGYDCGVFTCATANLLAEGKILDYQQTDTYILRHKIVFELINHCTSAVK